MDKLQHAQKLKIAKNDANKHIDQTVKSESNGVESCSSNLDDYTLLH